MLDRTGRLGSGIELIVEVMIYMAAMRWDVVWQGLQYFSVRYENASAVLLLPMLSQ